MNKYENRPYFVAMFVSRNKDNQNVKNFKQRNHSFLTQKNVKELLTDFNEFVNRGVEGETSRLYLSVNARKIDVIRKSLLKHLIDNEEANLTNLDKLVASLSMKPGTALTKKFLFDFDEGKDFEKLIEFIANIYDENEFLNEDICYSETPNGYAVVVNHGFDTRELLEKWQNVELKRDGMLFQSIKKKVSE